METVTTGFRPFGPKGYKDFAVEARVDDFINLPALGELVQACANCPLLEANGGIKHPALQSLTVAHCTGFKPLADYDTRALLELYRFINPQQFNDIVNAAKCEIPTESVLSGN